MKRIIEIIFGLGLIGLTTTAFLFHWLLSPYSLSGIISAMVLVTIGIVILMGKWRFTRNKATHQTMSSITFFALLLVALFVLYRLAPLIFDIL